MSGRIIKAGATYFALVFAVAFVLGTVRVLLLVPALGETGAVLVEAPALLLVILLAARWSVRRFQVAPGLPRLGVGLLALALQQAGDALVAIALRGQSLAAYGAGFLTALGAIYAAMLLVFLLAPLFVPLGPAGPSLRQINTRSRRPW